MRAHQPILSFAAALANRLWPTVKTPGDEPFCAVIGLHSSGSSALAGVLYHLGAHMGHKLGGHYGRDPRTACGFETAKLARICEDAIPFPATRMVQPAEVVTANLAGWIRMTQYEASRKKTVAVGKYPMMCRLGPLLVEICGRRLRVIHIDRALSESIMSLQRRCPQRSAEVIEKHQRWLWHGKHDFLASLPRESTLTITYDRLLSDARSVAQDMATFIGLRPTAAQVERAVASVDVGKRHVRAA